MHDSYQTTCSVQRALSSLIPRTDIKTVFSLDRSLGSVAHKLLVHVCGVRGHCTGFCWMNCDCHSSTSHTSSSSPLLMLTMASNFCKCCLKTNKYLYFNIHTTGLAAGPVDSRHTPRTSSGLLILALSVHLSC